MSVEKYLSQMQKIQQTLLEYLENEDDSGNEDQQEFKLFDDIENSEKPAIIKETFLMLLQIFNYHYRTKNLKTKTEKIILFYKDIIKQTFTNKEIFNIFKTNKIILLFLFKNQIITIDNSICNYLTKNNQNEYFSKEINSFYGNQNKKDDDDNDDDEFERKRQIGENDRQICEIIRNDSIDEFIVYVNKNSISLTSEIKPSIFETHPFLIDKEVSLIDYSAFFGSIQIFKYLQINGVEPTKSTWISAVYSKNPEMIYLINEKDEYSIHFDCFIESIKCHHNDMANYFKENFIHQKNGFLKYIVSSYNFTFIKEEEDFLECISEFVKFNYVSIVKEYLNSKDIIVKHMNVVNEKKLTIGTLIDVSIEVENIEIIDHLLKFVPQCANYIKTVYKDETMNCYFVKKSMICMAVEIENKEIVGLLLKHGCFQNDNHRFYSDYYREDMEDETTNYGDLETVFVIEYKPVLVTAIQNKNIEIVELLLSETMCVDVNKNYHIEKQMYLSEADTFDFYEENKSPLAFAIEMGNVEIVNILLECINIDVKNALMLKNIDVTKFKVYGSGHDQYHYDTDFNEAEYTEYSTALDIAKKCGNEEIYKILLETRLFN